jgi:DNA-binding MarR family transcriptional regulator
MHSTKSSAVKKPGWKEIIDRVLTAYNDISKSINPANLYQIELTSSQIKVLATFSEREYYTMTELSQMLSVTLPTMTAMIDRLIQGGLVTRERDERDRRVVLVRLTAEGKQIISNLMQIRKQEIEKILQFLGEEELDTFWHSIETVAQLLAKAHAMQEDQYNTTAQP